jgi:hypothetical protein
MGEEEKNLKRLLSDLVSKNQSLELTFVAYI